MGERVKQETPIERVAQIRKEFESGQVGNMTCLWAVIESEMYDAKYDAEDAERERCARIAEMHIPKGNGTASLGGKLAAEYIAAAIRVEP